MYMTANEEMLAGYAYPDAGYPDADADLTSNLNKIALVYYILFC